MSNRDKIIEICNLNFSYDNKQLVLENINLDIYNNDFLAIIGPNGGGKSTLIKLILGIIQTNNIKILNNDVFNIGYVAQNMLIDKSFIMSALDVVLMGLFRKNKFFYHKKEKDLAKESLKKVGIEYLLNKKISSMSGGELQRVLIARALISNPSILILDEPTSNIDIQGQKMIYELLQNINKTKTIIIVSHDISLILKYAKRVAFVNKNLSIHNEINNIHVLDNEHFCEIELLNHLKECSWKS